METPVGRKKGLLILLLLAVSLFMMGCGKPNLEKRLDPNNPVSVSIWHYYNGPQKIAFDEMINEFNETVGTQKGIIVEGFSQGNIAGLSQAVLDSANEVIGAENLPNIFAAYVDTAYQTEQMGIIASLDDYLTAGDKAQYVDSYVHEGQLAVDGPAKIFPIAKSTEVMMINKTDWEIFAQATDADVSQLETWEGIAQVAEAYYNWSGGKSFFGRDALANYVIIGAKQLGHDIFSIEDGKTVVQLDKPTMRKLWDNYYVPYVKGYYGSYGRFSSDDAKTGRILALIGSTSGAAYFPNQIILDEKNSYPIQCMVLPAPVFAGGEPYQVQQGAGMVVVKSEPLLEYASVEFLKWFTDSNRNLLFSTESGYLPVKKEANDLALLEKTIAEQEDMLPALKSSLPVALEQMMTCPLYTPPTTPRGTEIRNLLEDSLKTQCLTDRQLLLEQIAQGQAEAEAIVPYLSDAHFEQWFTQLESDLKTLTQ